MRRHWHVGRIPFYYEMKILFMLWLLSPTTKGSSIIYRKLVHPQLNRRESVKWRWLQLRYDFGSTAVRPRHDHSMTYITTRVCGK